MLVANSAQIREADRIQIETGSFPGIILMENAGRLATEALLADFPNQKDFLILVGPGNNGGDGLVMARYLYLAGKSVQIIYSHTDTRFQGDALINYRIVQSFPIEQILWTDWDRQIDDNQPPLIIDALLGTGLDQKLRGTIAEIIDYFRELPLTAIAVDLPSGLNASTGNCPNAPIPAANTYSFQLPKICHYVSPASDYCGKVRTLDIGLWPGVIEQLNIQREVLDPAFVHQHYRPRVANSHKGTFGHVLVIGGSAHMPGAIGLAAHAVLRAGAGLCTVICPAACRQTVLAQNPALMCIGLDQFPHLHALNLKEVLAQIDGKSAVIIGPGMGTHPDSMGFLAGILPHIKQACLLDADALNLIAKDPELWKYIGPHMVLSPHPGEMRRLMPGADVIHQRLESCEALAAEKKCTVILKGQNSLISTFNGYSYINPTGNAGMATAGSGDVLSGIIGGLLGQGYAPEIAAPLATWWHGEAGDQASQKLGMEAMTAPDLIQFLRIGL